MNNVCLWLWFLQKDHIGKKIRYRLVDDLGGIKKIYSSDYNDYSQLGYLSPEAIAQPCDKQYDFDSFLQRCRRDGITMLTIDDSMYPASLRNIADPPLLLYCKGQILDLNKYFCMAVVGTRKLSAYGAECATTLSREMAERGAVIVSGMASGIDAKGHRGALDAGMPTVAVLGCGVNIAYPASNRRLMDEILKTGMVISEYPPDTKPQKFQFPERNRIISGMSYATLVVEADIKSGSLITAKYSYEHGKDVFAVPGNINSPFSRGTNYLIKDGAYLVENCDDIMLTYEMRYPELFQNGIRLASEKTEKIINHSFETKKQILSDANITDTEDIILNVLNNDIVSADEIFQLTGIDMPTLSARLLMMELEGKVTKLPGNRYTAGKAL